LLIRLASCLQLAPLSLDLVGDDLLNHALGLAVSVGGAERAVLGNRDHIGEAGRVAVDSGRRGEDDVGHIVALHAAQQRDAAANIDAVVLEGDLARLADSLQGGEVNDAVDLGMLREHLIEGLLVGNVDFVEEGALLADALNAVDGDDRRIGEIINDNNIVAVFKENEGGERANVPGTTR